VVEDGEELVIGGEGRDKGPKAQKDIVPPPTIDDFWVQRQISKIYPDPVTTTDKASSVLFILGSESSLRDCVNQLMELFDYQSHQVIRIFIKDRDTIV
jgi:pre-mRNA-splicing helicase BRR2